MPNESKAGSILIVGASRGLGKGLAELYAVRGWTVLATVRTISDHNPAGVELAVVDINDAQTVDALHAQTAERKFDIIFIVAGISQPDFKAIHEISVDYTLNMFRNNAISPLLFAEKFLDRTAPGGHMVFMTSGMGSVATLTVPGADAYRASKAALNMLVKSFHVRHQKDGFTTTLMHPGWVRTDLGGDRAPIDVATSAAGMIRILEERNGKDDLVYIEYNGVIVPW